jgi:hypothetical protein
MKEVYSAPRNSKLNDPSEEKPVIQTPCELLVNSLYIPNGCAFFNLIE